MEWKRGAWTIKSSEKIYADAFAEVLVDEVLKPDGGPFD